MQPENMQLDGEPDTGDEVTVEDALVYAADTPGNLTYILDLNPRLGYAS